MKIHIPPKILHGYSISLPANQAARYDSPGLKHFAVLGRMAMAERIILRIELTPSAKEHLNRVSDTMGMTQVAMLSRVIEWFSQQPELIQRIIVGHLPPQIEQRLRE